MKYLLLSLLVVSMNAMSAEKVVAQTTTTKPAAATQDKTLNVTPETKEKKAADETALYTNDHEMKANVTCKTKAGADLKQGEKGYEECLKKVKGSKTKAPSADVKVDLEKK